VALAAWRPLLYGIHFELVSDHASLRHLFQQKAPSARILRLCEFLADFDFQEVQFVKGSDMSFASPGKENYYIYIYAVITWEFFSKRSSNYYCQLRQCRFCRNC
jgi:hypothetical protein